MSLICEIHESSGLIHVLIVPASSTWYHSVTFAWPMMSFLEVESYVQSALQNYVSQCQICFACSLISGPESAQLIDRAQDDEPSNYAPGREGPLA